MLGEGTPPPLSGPLAASSGRPTRLPVQPELPAFSQGDCGEEAPPSKQANNRETMCKPGGLPASLMSLPDTAGCGHWPLVWHPPSQPATRGEGTESHGHSGDASHECLLPACPCPKQSQQLSPPFAPTGRLPRFMGTSSSWPARVQVQEHLAPALTFRDPLADTQTLPPGVAFNVAERPRGRTSLRLWMIE